MTQSFIAPQFKLYGFLVGLGILASYLYCLKNSKKYGLRLEDIDLTFILCSVFALLGARLYHILSSYNYYLLHPVEILYFWQGGLGIFGALLGGFLGVLTASKLKKIKLITILNLLFPSFLIGQAIGRIGNYFNKEGFGPITTLPWGVYVNDQARHPTFFYESLLCLIVFLIFIKIPLKIRTKIGFPYYLISYGIIRFLTEFFRIDTWQFGNIHVGHIIALVMIVTGVIIIVKTDKHESLFN